MRPLILLIISIFILSQTRAQDDPVRFTVQKERINDTLYEFQITGQVKKGWHVYAEKDASLELDEITIQWPEELVNNSEGQKIRNTSVLIQDPIFDKKQLSVYKDDFSLLQVLSIPTSTTQFEVTVKCFAANDSSFIPVEQTLTVQLEKINNATLDPSKSLILQNLDLDNPAAPCGDQPSKGKGLLAIFLLGFGGGLIALLTPCIFPMIPVTVSYFTGRAPSRKQGIKNGTIYGLFILLIYTLSSSPFHLLGNIDPQIFNRISTNAWVNVFFFAVFIAFSLSFFGLFEIKLPASISNAAGSRSGIFFMALTLVIVSFSCTGIILGSLLVNALSSNGSAWQLTAGMAGFGFALALPFSLFAIFPQWLRTLPKSGGWLDKVKKTLAFIELALAIKFLSNADLVEHWGILKREIFIASWIIIAVGLSLYLFGVFTKTEKKIRSYTEPRKAPMPWLRLSTGLLSLAFALYMVPGLGNSPSANLKMLSGFPPPMSYSIYNKKDQAKGVEPDIVNDFDKALQLARKQNKPVLIDFTGWACVNCRKMEELVWTEPSIKKLITEKFILVSLYVDDRKKLPAASQFTLAITGEHNKSIRTVGDKWAAFQARNFKQVTQPQYAILSPDGKLMTHPVGYTSDHTEYKKWLNCGLQAFQQTAKN